MQQTDNCHPSLMGLSFHLLPSPNIVTSRLCSKGKRKTGRATEAASTSLDVSRFSTQFVPAEMRVRSQSRRRYLEGPINCEIITAVMSLSEALCGQDHGEVSRKVIATFTQ